MATHVYTVHVPPDLSSAEATERAVFLKDGIGWPAFFFAALWLLWHRMWLPFMGYLLFILGLALIEAGLGEMTATIVAVLGQLLFALEANNLRRWTLARRGWREVGESFGRSRGEAEIRFFQGEALRAGRADQSPSPGARGPAGRRSTPSASAVPAVPRRRDEEEPGLGLFPEPER